MKVTLMIIVRAMAANLEQDAIKFLEHTAEVRRPKNVEYFSWKRASQPASIYGVCMTHGTFRGEAAL